MTFKHPLRAWRDGQGDEGWSQEQAAKYVGIRQSQWSRFETGLTHPHPKLAKHISSKTGIGLDVLLGVSDNEPIGAEVGTDVKTVEKSKDLPNV